VATVIAQARRSPATAGAIDRPAHEDGPAVAEEVAGVVDDSAALAAEVSAEAVSGDSGKPATK